MPNLTTTGELLILCKETTNWGCRDVQKACKMGVCNSVNGFVAKQRILPLIQLVYNCMSYMEGIEDIKLFKKAAW